MADESDIKGDKFGRLVALERFYDKWICQCACGDYILARSSDLFDGRKKDCGCSNRKKPPPGAVCKIMELNGMLN